jgi:hypothetical protein
MAHVPSLRITRYSARTRTAPRNEVTEISRRTVPMDMEGQEKLVPLDWDDPANTRRSSVGEDGLVAVRWLPAAVETESGCAVALVVGRGVAGEERGEEGTGVPVAVGVGVGETPGRLVAVKVGVTLGAPVGVDVGARVAVGLGVEAGRLVGVNVGVRVGEAVAVAVADGPWVMDSGPRVSLLSKSRISSQ